MIKVKSPFEFAPIVIRMCFSKDKRLIFANKGQTVTTKDFRIKK